MDGSCRSEIEFWFQVLIVCIVFPIQNLAREEIRVVAFLVPRLVLEQDHVDEYHENGRSTGGVLAGYRDPLLDYQEHQVPEQGGEEEELRQHDRVDVQVCSEKPAKKIEDVHIKLFSCVSLPIPFFKVQLHSTVEVMRMGKITVQK